MRPRVITANDYAARRAPLNVEQQTVIALRSLRLVLIEEGDWGPANVGICEVESSA